MVSPRAALFFVGVGFQRLNTMCFVVNTPIDGIASTMCANSINVNIPHPPNVLRKPQVP